MTYTFIKGSIQHMLFGFLSVFLKWAVLSGIISLALVFSGLIATISATSSVSIRTLIDINPINVLTMFPQYRYLNYIEILWAGYLLPVIIGGGLFTVVIAQGKGNEQIVDFYSDVAGNTIVVIGGVIVLWILSGLAYLLFFQAPILSENEMWSAIMTQGIEGLHQLNMTAPNTLLNVVMKWIYPYFPIPIEIYGYIHIIGNIHAGWVGNKWNSESSEVMT